MVVSQGIAAAAARYGLGRPERRFRSRVVLAPKSVWAAIGASAVLAWFLVPSLLAVVLVPATLAGIAGYVFLKQPEGGRRWVVLYKHGLVEASADLWLRVLRWEQVCAVSFERGSPHAMFVRFEVDDGAEPARVSMLWIGPQRELIAAVQRHVQPLALARARSSLRDLGRATFGPIVLTRDRLQRRAEGGGYAPVVDELPWTEVGSSGLVDGDRLLVRRRGYGQPWFEGRVPNAPACARLIDETTAPPVASRDFAEPGLAVQDPVLRAERVRSRRYVALLVAVALTPALGSVAFADGGSQPPPRAVSTAASRTTAAPPTPTPSWTVAPNPLPYDISGFSDICTGSSPGYGRAAEYDGPGPHPIAVVGSPATAALIAGLPAQWRTERPDQVRLVVCLLPGVWGGVARQCDYEGRFRPGLSETANLRWHSYTINVYVARTGKLLAIVGPVSGEDTSCAASIYLRPTETPPDQHSRLTSRQVVDAIAAYVG